MIRFLQQMPLFRGCTGEEIETILHHLGARTATFPKGALVCRAGERTEEMGLVLSGGVYIEHDDVWGNASLLGHVEAGQLFAEAYACVREEPMLVHVIAAEKSEILFLNLTPLREGCPNACRCRDKLMRNLLQITARKNLNLSRRILHTAPKTIRGRLLSYLSQQAVQNGGNTFDIPFNRQQLADYLEVDRSALSAELSKMQREGILTARKNHFVLHESAEE